MSDNQDIITTDELAAQSQVSESASRRVASKSMKLIVIGIIVVMTGFAYLSSKAHSRHKENAQSSSAVNPYALQENLNALERMQQEAALKKEAHNYTSTPGGVKIDNPNTFRSRPPKRNDIDPELAARMNAPTTFINIDPPLTSQNRKNPEVGVSMMAGKDANSAFLNTKNSIESVNAIALPHPDFTLSAGEFIPATLETAINSDLPGMVRALTARDVYALTGNRVLIPKGARLIGQYSSGNIAGAQTRVLISWTRVQLPNGIVVTLNSPSADSLGRGGQGADAIDRHFMERFSTGLLYSVLGAASATVGVNSTDEYNSASQFRMAIANNLEQSAQHSLQQSQTIQSTLHIDQGAAINVFVARDLNFFNVARGVS